MNPNPGTPFIYYAIVASFVMAGLAALFPLLAIPFSLLPVSIVLGLDVDYPDLGLSRLDIVHASMAVPSPFLLAGHALLWFGGRCFNNGRYEPGCRHLTNAGIFMLLYMALAYLFAAGAWFVSGGNRTIIIAGLLVSALYVGSLVAVLAAAIRTRKNFEKGLPVPARFFVRRFLFWGIVSVAPILTAVLLWRSSADPRHEISVVNRTGKPIYLQSVQIGDAVHDYRGTTVFPFEDNEKFLGGKRVLYVNRELIFTSVRVAFRVREDEPIREYAAMVNSGWYIDCSFEIAVEEDRIDSSECRTENRREAVD